MISKVSLASVINSGRVLWIYPIVLWIYPIVLWIYPIVLFVITIPNLCFRKRVPPSYWTLWFESITFILFTSTFYQVFSHWIILSQLLCNHLSIVVNSTSMHTFIISLFGVLGDSCLWTAGVCLKIRKKYFYFKWTYDFESIT